MRNEVKLSAREMMQAAFVGTMRRIEENSKGSAPTYSLGDMRKYSIHHVEWGVDIEGALGEMAAAKFLRRYWIGSRNRPGKGEDVDGYHVRTTDKPGGHLTIRPEDDDDANFVLVIGARGKYRVVGWHNAGEAKQRDEWITDYGQPERPGVWAVPQEDLRPFVVQQCLEL
jgi:hypothetical protein